VYIGQLKRRFKSLSKNYGIELRYGFVAFTDELPIEPSSYEEAEKSQEWKNAMKEEI
jgi:hypothetical protein